MFGDLELEFGGFAGEGEGVIVVVVVIIIWVGGGLDVGDGGLVLLLLMLLLLLGRSGSGFSARGGTCLDNWRSDTYAWGVFFGVWIGGEGGKGTVCYGAVAGWSAAEFAGRGAGG